MAGDRADDRAETPRIESHTVARGGRPARAPQPVAQQQRERAARPVEKEQTERKADTGPERRRPPAREPGDRPTRSSLQNVLEQHRRDMSLASVSDRTAGRPTAEPEPDIPPPPRRNAAPPREEHARNPRDPRSPQRPSITTLSQARSYGPQNFARSDVIDKPHARPPIWTAGGAELRIPATPPAPAQGAASRASQERATPAQER